MSLYIKPLLLLGLFVGFGYWVSTPEATRTPETVYVFVTPDQSPTPDPTPTNTVIIEEESPEERYYRRMSEISEEFSQKMEDDTEGFYAKLSNDRPAPTYNIPSYNPPIVPVVNQPVEAVTVVKDKQACIESAYKKQEYNLSSGMHETGASQILQSDLLMCEIN